MEIGKYKYKGFEYIVHFTNKGDWRENLNKFYVESANGSFKTGYHNTFYKATTEFNHLIDNFLDALPRSVDELVSKLAELLVWTGYEDCHLDEEAAKALITAFLGQKT